VRTYHRFHLFDTHPARADSYRPRLVLVCAVAFIVLTALAAAETGYRNFWVSYDILPDYKNAANFVDNGLVPVKGGVNSLGTFNPPGYGWLYEPGAWLFPGQPGLAGAIGSAMLFTGTVTGLALLLTTGFGLATSIGTVAMFSYSSIGMFYATSLWPRAHVFFYCWTVYFLKRWALDAQRGGFAAALGMYLLGLYCFFEIAPLGLLFVAVWIIYRPTIAWRPVMACVVVLLLVWWPYLFFEVGRAGLDVRSFITGSVSAGLHDVGTASGPATSAVSIPSSIAHGLFMNFARSLSPIRAAVLCFASVVGLAFATTRGQRLIERGIGRSGDQAAIDLHRFLGLALVVPWFLMLILVLRESEDPSRRFWWFWLFQTYFIGFSVFWLLPRLHIRRALVVAAQCFMLVAILPLGAVRQGLMEIHRSGYGGTSERIAAIDYLASTLKASGRSAASIGYELAVPSWQRTRDGHMIFKVGNDYDLVFRRRHGIDNQSDAESGFSSGDEFRIVEIVSTDRFRDVRLQSGDLSQFTEMARFGNYWVGKRSPPLPAQDRQPISSTPTRP
jgi:hypothetical protein